MKPSGNPKIIGPKTDPPTKEEVALLVKQSQGKQTKENKSKIFFDVLPIILVIFVIFIIVFLWKKKKKS